MSRDSLAERYVRPSDRGPDVRERMITMQGRASRRHEAELHGIFTNFGILTTPKLCEFTGKNACFRAELRSESGRRRGGIGLSDVPVSTGNEQLSGAGVVIGHPFWTDNRQASHGAEISRCIEREFAGDSNLRGRDALPAYRIAGKKSTGTGRSRCPCNSSESTSCRVRLRDRSSRAT